MHHMHPDRVMEVEIFMAQHPEVNWDENEVLYGFPDDLDPKMYRHTRTVPKTWWSKAERDVIYGQLKELGFNAFQDLDGDWHLNCDPQCRA